MQLNTKLKVFAIFLLSAAGGLFLTYAANSVSIEASVNTLVQYIQRIIFAGTSTADRDALTNPAIGTVIFNSDLKVNQVWNGQYWHNMGSVCSAVTELQLTDVNNVVGENYGGGVYNISEKDQKDGKIIGYTILGGQNTPVRARAVIDNNGRILSNEDATNLYDIRGSYIEVEINSNSPVNANPTTRRNIIGGNIHDGVIYICGALLDELSVNASYSRQARVGQTGQLIVQVQNQGFNTLKDVEVSLEFPSHIQVINSNGGSQSTSGSNTVVTWDIGDLSVGDTAYTVDVIPTQEGNYDIIADGYTSTEEGNPNNRKTSNIYIQSAPQIDIAIIQGAYPQSVSTIAGNTITLNAIVNNNSVNYYDSQSVTIEATWTTTSGSDASYTGGMYCYNNCPQSRSGNTARWNIFISNGGMFQPTLQLYSTGAAEVQVTWTITVAGDVNPSNNTYAQYATWTAGQTGQAGTYNYGISSGLSVNYSTEAGNSIQSTITPGYDTYSACMAGYGARIIATLGSGMTYDGSDVVGQAHPGTYDSMMRTITWQTYSPAGCYEFNGMYNFTVNTSSSSALSSTITWSVTNASGSNSDLSPSNNSTTHQLQWYPSP